jgi:tetratricopeptide (TPR) repeat protein
MKRLLSIGIVAALSFVIYSNSLAGGFVFDDHRAILTNDDLDAQKTSLLDLFIHDFWGGTMSRRESHKSYRPLTVLSYRYLNHYFSGLSPYSYHFVNVIFHVAASVVFLLASEIILIRHDDHDVNEIWPLLSALLFAAHSIHTEAVASVVGRAESLSCLFFLFSFICYAYGLKSSVSARHLGLVAMSVFFAFLSMLSKEQGITAIGVCAAYDIFSHWPWKNKDNYDKSNINSTKFVQVAKRIGLLGICGGTMMWFRMSMNYGSEPIFKPEEMKAAFHSDKTVRILSFSNIYTWNFWLLLAPSALCCDWSLGSVPLVEDFYDIRNMWSLILFIAIGLLIVKALKGDVEVGMGLTLMLLPFLPSAGIVFKVGFVIAERVLYLPSLGFCLLVAIGAKRISQRVKNEKIVLLAIGYVLLIMSAKTISRNKDWSSDLLLFESGVKMNPNNVKMINNYAMELKSAARFEESQKYYKMAMEVEPDYAEVYFNYGNLLSETGNYKEAVENFEKAMTFPSMYGKTLNNAATMYFKLGKYKEAEAKFKESLELNPNQPMTYNNLASLYGETKRYKESETMFTKAIEMNPSYTEAYFNLGTLLYQMGKIDEAENHLKYALRLNPNHHGALNNLKVINYYRNKNN